MIREFEFFHGAVIARIVHGVKNDVAIRPYPSSSNASYVLDDKIGLYIKHSGNRMTPWHFSFAQFHQNEILEMRNHFGEVFIALVCKDDGIVCLSFDELKIVLNEIHDRHEWIKASRHSREKYQIKGSDGKLVFKIGANKFPGKVIEALNRPIPAPRGVISWLVRQKVEQT